MKLASKASLALTERGARILVASTEIGQGTRTMLAQIVADTLGVPYDDVEVNAADTSEVPDSGPTVASRTCMIVGRHPAALRRGHARAARRAHAARSTCGSTVRSSSRNSTNGRPRWSGTTRRIAATPTAATAGRATSSNSKSIRIRGQVRPVKFTTVHEIGKAIHPMLAAGQIEGGSAQGLGWALLEDVVMRDGRMANHTLTNYIVPTTLDTPEMDVVMLERPVQTWAVRREGRGRDADRRTRAGRDQRAASRRLRSPRDSGDAGKADVMQFTLNGKRVRVDAHPMTRLLDVLREYCGLTGTKEGCGEGECGACTVLVDRRAGECVPRAVRAGRQTRASRPSRAWADGIRCSMRSSSIGGAQCGICTPGMILAAVALGPRPSRERDEDRPGRQHLPLHRLFRHLHFSPARGRLCSDPSLTAAC